MFRVALGHVSPTPAKKRRRVYSPTQLTNAYLDVIDKKMPVHKCAKLYGVPEQTLRDRVNGRICVDNVTYGGIPLFGQEEEARLTRHIREIATVGYGYTRSDVINLASEYAVLLGKRDRDTPLTHRWFYGFLSRWPELKVQRPKTLSELRSKACSTDSITRYFEELGRILDKYGLKDKPQLIYNVDEKGVQQNFRPRHVVSSADHVPSVVISERSSTTTILACGNALGYQIPPYFVFAGARMRDELLEGASTGAQGTVSKSGWSNSGVFLDYLQNHFVKYAKSGPDDHILLMYDGHRSHISPFLVDWAKDNKIILFVLPPHTSHILQPMDVGCFGAFSKIYSDECMKHQRNTGSVIGRYNVCSVACKAYTKGLSQANLQAAFRKSGIYPFNPSEIDVTVFETNQLRQQFQNEHGTTDVVTETPEQTEHIAEHPVVGEDSSVMSVQLIDTCDSPGPVHIEPTPPPQTNTPMTTDTFFKKKRPVFVPPVLKERRSISKVVAGKAITEVDVSIRLQKYFSESQTKKSKFQPPLKSAGTTIRHTTGKSTVKNPKKLVNPVRTSESPKPGPSGVQTHAHVIQDSASDSDESEYNPKDLCCVCGNNFPDALNQLPYAEFATWGKCDVVSCAHWVHLKYCCPVRVLRRHSTFYCPCHGLPWTGSEE